MIETTAFWGFTINNYDETDLALVQQGYPDYVRELVYTFEKGKEGTPHIQGWLKLQRQQRRSFVKKLFPRANFTAMMSDEYNENMKKYAQKLDETAESGAIHRFNDPIPDPVMEFRRICEIVMDQHMENRDWYKYKEKDFMFACKNAEWEEVRDKPKLAKFYVGALYKNVKKEYWRAVCCNIEDELKEAKRLENTHTHTHKEKIFSHQDSHNNAEEDRSTRTSEGEGYDDYEEGESTEDEGDDESRSSVSSEEYVSEEDGE